VKAHRAILIKLPRDKCDANYIKRLMALTNLTYRGYGVWVPDLPKTMQHQLYGSFKNYMGSLVFGTTPKKWFAETWVPLKTLRVYSDDTRRGATDALVVLDFKKNVIKLHQVCKNEPGYSIEAPMPRWVIDRVGEGGDVRFAMIGLKDDKPYLALIAEREVESYIPSEYILAVDVNSWGHGIAWGLIRSGRIVSFKQEGLNPQRAPSPWYLQQVLKLPKLITSPTHHAIETFTQAVS